MANYLKPKVGISLLSISIIVLIPLLETNFNARVTIKRWSKLTWDDFQGSVPLFNRYEAAIASAVYLEYDSTKKRFHAYAGQNNVRSWAKRTRPNQDYELNHEQYHFNITELHARKLNEYIAEHPDGSEYLYNLRRSSINIDLRKMQKKYDTETNHCLIYDRQRWWEFQIDSLLSLDSGWVTDNFSGAKAYFPTKPDFSNGITKNQNRYREYEASKYGMSYSMISFQNEIFDEDILENIFRNYTERQDTIKLRTLDTTGDTKKAFLILRDSSRQTWYSLWHHNENYLYYVSVAYPNNTGDTIGFSKIAKSFINSFSVVNTDSIWIAELESANSVITYSNINKMEKPSDHNIKYCLATDEPKGRGFYRGPFFRDDGALFLAYDNIEHADSLHYKDILLLNDDVYSYIPDPKGQIYFVPAAKLPKEQYRIDFGYILEEQKVKGCYEFFYQSLEINETISNESLVKGH